MTDSTQIQPLKRPQNQPPQTSFRQPQFGWGVLPLALVYAIVMYLMTDLVVILIESLVAAANSTELVVDVSQFGDPAQLYRQLWLNGVCYCGLVWGVWIVLSSTQPVWRALAVMAIGGMAFSLRFNQVQMGTDQLIATLLGLGLATVSMLHVWRIPHWGFGRRPPRPIRKLSLIDLFLLTAAVAVLFAIARLVVPPIDRGQYWLVAAAAWIGLATIACCTWTASLQRKWYLMIAYAAGSVGLVAAMAIGVASAEQWLGQQTVRDSPLGFPTSVVLFLTIVLAFHLTSIILGLVTRFQSFDPDTNGR